MAGPSIVVRVLADLKGLQSSFDDAGRGAQTASANIHDAFSGAIGLLNQSGVLGPFGNALSTVNDAFSQLADQGHEVGQVMLGLGGAFAGVGLGLSVLGSKDQAARQQLQAAIAATGASWDDYSKRVDEAIRHDEKFGDSASVTQNALQSLTEATNSPQKALDLLGEAADLAAAKHESLTEAATQLGKVYNGNTKILKEFGINIASTAGLTKAAATASKEAAAADQRAADAKQHLADLEAVYAGKTHLTTGEQLALRTAQEKVVTSTNHVAAAHQKATAAQQAATKATTGLTGAQQLGQRVAGQADAQANTFIGHVKEYATHVEDLAAAWGNKYGAAIQSAGVITGFAGSVITGVKGVIQKLTAAQEAATAATEAATAATAAQAVALDTEAAAAVTAEAASLPLIATFGLVVLGIAAVGVAAYELLTHWKTVWRDVKGAVVAVWDWIKANWPLLLAILTGPVGLAVLEIVRHWNGLISFLQGLPGRIAAIAAHMFDSLYLNAKRVVDQINNLQIKIAGIPLNIGSILGGVSSGHIPGTNIGIPHLAQGGLITQTGLVYAHAGEAITPAPASARMGPAIQFTGPNHFSSEVDVEAFMRRAAWVVQTQRI